MFTGAQFNLDEPICSCIETTIVWNLFVDNLYPGYGIRFSCPKCNVELVVSAEKFVATINSIPQHRARFKPVLIKGGATSHSNK